MCRTNTNYRRPISRSHRTTYTNFRSSSKLTYTLPTGTCCATRTTTMDVLAGGKIILLIRRKLFKSKHFVRAATEVRFAAPGHDARSQKTRNILSASRAPISHFTQRVCQQDTCGCVCVLCHSGTPCPFA